MLKFLLLPFLLITSLSIRAQKPGTNNSGIIAGIVVEENNTPIESATISLFQSKDTVSILKTLTAQDGVFFFENLDSGYYHVQITMTGHSSLRIDSIYIRSERNDFNLGEIKLARSPLELQLVTIYAEKPLYENKDGKLTFNASESALSNAASATDLLKQTPLVNVDSEGKVLLRGKEVKILIDDKPVDMDARQLQDLLESMSGSMIEKIEVLTTPPPQYANERGGVINIVTKKGKVGINGRVNVNYGTRGEGGINLSGSYRKKGTVINVSAGIIYNEYNGNSFSNRQNMYTDSTNFFKTFGGNNNNNLRPSFRLAVDRDINKYNSLSFSFLYNSSVNNSYALTEYQNINRFNEVYRYSMRNVGGEAENISPSVNLSYTMKTKDPREVLRVITGLNFNSNSNGRDFYQQFMDPASMAVVADSFQQQNISIHNHTLNVRISYDKPLKNKKFSISTGANFSYHKSRNKLSTLFMKKPENIYIESVLLSNNLMFFQQVAGLRGSLRYDIMPDFYINGGVLYEQTATDFKLTITTRDFRNNYGSALPFLTIMKKWESGYSLTGSYKRTVQRPGFNHMNPSVDYSDPYNLRFGNPFLKPYYADNFDIILGYWTKKYNLNLSGGYNILSNIYSSIRTLQPDGKTTVTWENISSRDEYETHLWSGVTINKKLKINLSAAYTYNVYSLKDRTERKFRNGGSFNSSVNGNFQVNTLMNATANFSYNSFANPQGKTRNTLSMNIGVQQKFLKKNLTVSINIIDPFTDQNNNYVLYGNGYILENSSTTRSRNLRIAVAYTFKKQQKAKPVIKKKN